MKLLLEATQPAPSRPDHVTVAFDTATDLTDVRTTPARELVLGVEGELPLTRRKLVTLVRRMVLEAKARRYRRLVLDFDALHALVPTFERTELARQIGENVHLANHEYSKFREEPKKGWAFLDELVVRAPDAEVLRASLVLGEIVAREVNDCRDLANTPGGDMTPLVLANHAKKAARGTGATVRVLGRTDIEKLKMGALLGVARGSVHEPKFIIAEYWGGKRKTAPVVLVGKGVTFDTGGLSIKPADYMYEMHLDMSGGAAVLHALFAAARLKLPVNVVALVPAVENMPGGESYRPGDILRSMSGKTIEVLNTDAEGRLILADALTYAVRYKPTAVIDVATLTGAALVALGTKATALMTKEDAFAETLLALGEESGDYLWRLPLWDEYKGMVKGKFADLANVPHEQSRFAGSIGGGMFLAEFATGYPEGTPWAHLDIAPRMTSDKGDQLAPGAAGAPVRLLVRYLEHVGRTS